MRTTGSRERQLARQVSGKVLDGSDPAAAAEVAQDVFGGALGAAALPAGVR